VTNATGSKSNRPPSKSSRREVERRRSQRNMRLSVGLSLLVAVGVLWYLLTPKKSGPPVGAAAAGTVTIARSSGPPLVAGDSIPEFKAPMMGGGTMTWSDYAGKPVVLAIWASWCPHCQKELPILGSTQAKYPGVQLVSVTTAFGQEAGPTPLEFMQQKNLSFPVGLDDANRTILTGLGVVGFPTVYYVGSDGKVVQMTEGEIDPAKIDQYFASLH
jgi:thiol-disulfide isomerase/thioredoxin